MSINHPLISIIVPVYNGEKYLRQCIDSILGQSYTHWELLLIDDGSTDNSGAICDYYANDEKITVIHKNNEGQAIARNEGLKKANGELISFIDCDDWMEPTMYEEMVEAMMCNKADAAVCGFVEEYPSRQKRINADGNIRVIEGCEAVKRVLQGKIGSYFWSMLYRKSLLVEPIPALKVYEDHAVIFKWLSHAENVVLINKTFYHYRQSQSSSVHAEDLKKETCFFDAIKERYSYVQNHQILSGWEQENRVLFLKSSIKVTKDAARAPMVDEEQKIALIDIVRETLKAFMPVSRKEIGTKCYVRFTLMMISIPMYIRVLNLSSFFSLKKKKKKMFN